MRLEELTAMALEAADIAQEYDEPLQEIVRDIALHARMNTQAPEEWAYRNYYDMALRLGTPRVAALALPEYYEPMPARECFRNAWKLVQESDDLIYCEGFAQWKGFAMEHAWVEEVDGTIIDPTWSGLVQADDGENPVAAYLGVRYRADFAIARSARSGWASVMTGDMHADNEILRRGLKMHNGIAIDIGGEHD